VCGVVASRYVPTTDRGEGSGEVAKMAKRGVSWT
jgi:hypothetical protein